MSTKRYQPIWPQIRQGHQAPPPAGLGPRLYQGHIKQSASTGQGEDAPTTQYAHNGLGQRVFKTEPLYSSTPASGSSNKNLNNLLADDDEPQGEPPGLIQQILNFFSKLWSPGTSDAEKLGFSYIYAEDGSLLGEYGSGGSNSTGTAQYIYLPTASGPMPIAAVIKGQTYAVHSDHLNTPRKLTQPDGQVAWQWAYSAFGDEQPTLGAKRFTSETTTPTTGATSIPEVTFNLRYPGQYFDPETKLHYNYFRTYAPGTGRYTQGDPIGLDGGWNRFAYVGADPLNFADDEGLNRRAAAPTAPSVGQALLNFQGIHLTNQVLRYQPNYPAYSYVSAPGQGFTAANIGQLQIAVQRWQAAGVCSSASSPNAPFNAVITETLNGSGNLTSAHRLSASDLLTAGQKFLGSNYREIGKPGSGVFRSADGTRQFRIDGNSLAGNHSPGIPHGHLETYAPGSSRPTANNHIPFFD